MNYTIAGYTCAFCAKWVAATEPHWCLQQTDPVEPTVEVAPPARDPNAHRIAALEREVASLRRMIDDARYEIARERRG